MDAYFKAVEPFSADDTYEGSHVWGLQAAMAGIETAHLHPFRQMISRTRKIAGITDVADFQAGYERWPAFQALKPAMVSNDGLVRLLSCCCLLRY